MAPHATSRDLRSDSTNARRFRKRSAKYHKFALTSDGQLAAPNQIAQLSYSVLCTLDPVFKDAPRSPLASWQEEEGVPALSKRKLYEIATAGSVCGSARGWKYHMRRDPWCRKELRKIMEARGGMKAAKKAARDWREEWEDEEAAMWNDQCVPWICADDSVWEHYDPEELEPVEVWESYDPAQLEPVVAGPPDVTPLADADVGSPVVEVEMLDRLEWVDVWDDEFWIGDGEDDWSEVGDPEAFS
jgi:hypothetical protein